MSVVQEIRDAPVVGETPISAEVREEALDRAVAELAAEGWELETKPDIERVLVGHNRFRRIWFGGSGASATSGSWSRSTSEGQSPLAACDELRPGQ